MVADNPARTQPDFPCLGVEIRPDILKGRVSRV